MRLTHLYDQEYTKPTPQVGDVLEIQLPNDTVVETTIAGVDRDGNILVHLDETGINMVEQQGMITESFDEQDVNPVVSAVTRRIMLTRPDLLKHGPDKVMQAIDEVADWVGDVDEIGSSDVSAWVKHVERILGDSVEEAAPAAVRWASGAALGTLAGTGGVIAGGVLGGLFAPIFGGIAGWNGAKLGMQAADDIWDWAAKKLGGNEHDFAMSHVRAAAQGKDTFEYKGKSFPVTLPKTDVSKAIQAVKQVAESRLAEGQEDEFMSALKGLKSWQVVIRNNYYRGKYTDYSGRYYYVLATSPEEARQVVLDNADAILKEILAMKSHNGRKILPRSSAIRITDKQIGEIKDGTEAGRMSTANYKTMFSPQGQMRVKLSNGAVVDVEEEQSVTEGGFKNVKAIFSGYGNYMKSRAPNVFKHFDIKVLDKNYSADEDIIEYTVISDRDSLDRARAYLERSDQFGGMILQKRSVTEAKGSGYTYKDTDEGTYITDTMGETLFVPDVSLFDHGYKQGDRRLPEVWQMNLELADETGARIIDDEQDIEESQGNIGQKLKKLYRKFYRLGDDAVDHVYHNAPLFAQYWDQYEGDIDSIVQELSPKNLQRIYNELVPLAHEEGITEAKYHGRDVQLGKPVRGGPKKFYVYVRDPATKNIKKVNFGDPNMSIKKHSPKHRKSFRARHNCSNPGPRTKARYWSCRAW